jgi:curli production assembly/transport component CsgG|tara:strand:+ start:695 stop:1699 length:1005 start_codon:yes stop_codon:yes gene_type:complete
MIRNLMIALLSVGFLSGCASMALPGDKNCTTDFLQCIEEPREVELPTFTKLRMLPPAETRPIVAVYTFSDLTGQRLSSDGAASFSTAVTQGARDLLIDALKAAGADSDPKGTWFRVVERGLGLDHLVRERQIIRSTRDSYATAESPTQDVQPLLFAGVILEGGVIGYDSNIETGGNGARYLGIGTTNQYRRDSVVVSLRAVSVLTGEVILNVQTYKTILSVGMGGDVFKFLHMDTQLLELESGMTENESVTWGVRSAIEASVYALIEQGDERGFWKINYPPADQEVETIETTPIDAEAYKNTLSTVNGTDTDSSGTKKIKTFDSKIASGENEND